MLIRIIILFLSVVFCNINAQQGIEITQENWFKHPAIKEIRVLEILVDTDAANNFLTKETREFEYCQPSYVFREIYQDDSGLVRKYIKEGGSGDSSVQIAYYYDADANLRFVELIGGAVNGTTMEYRLYFSATGEQVWQNSRLLEGEGWTFAGHIEQDALPFDALEDFMDDGVCEELRSTSE